MNSSNHCVEKSQICNWKKLNIVEVLKDLVAADSEGDCVANLLALQNFLLIFRESDSINYLQYG